MAQETKKMISIWLWVGLILGIYGLIVLGTGIAAIGSSNVVVVRGHNPGLWWGGLMTVSGLVFSFIGIAANRKQQ
jgi:hypothetical protein